MSITSTIVHRADIRFHEADVALRPFVGCFWVITAERGATIRVVPDGTTAISIQLQTSEPSGWLLRGPLIRADERRFSSPTIMVGVRLRPGVAFILSGIAAQTIVGCRISLRDIAAFRQLVACEPSLRTSAECIDALQRFLMARLESTSVHGVVAAALREIEQEHGCLRVAELASRCGVSQRHLNRLMCTWVGYGPKSYATVVRFQEALTQMEHAPGLTGAALASETGYFDQAHLTHNLTRLAGATPGQLTSSCLADFSKTRCDDVP